MVYRPPPYKFNYQYKQSPIDYAGLANIARSRRGQVIVCEARDPKTDEAPDYLPFSDFRKAVTSRRSEGKHTHSSELIWTNSAHYSVSLPSEPIEPWGLL